MRDVGDLITALGGVAEVGRIIGKRTEHVGSMKARRFIPARYWSTLINSERGKGINLNWETLSRVNFPTVEDK